VIRERLGVPVAFDNDVDAAAVGEYRWGAGREAGSLCYLTIGTGIGAGLLIDGQPWHGLVHPEVGHMRLARGRDPDAGGFGGVCPMHADCWEGLASGPSLQARWGVAPDELPAEHEAWAIEAEYVALGILSIVLVFSPERVIVGGGVMEHPGLLDLVRRRVVALMAGYLPTPLVGDEVDSYLVAPALGDRAGVLGALALAERLVETT
jgi:fructokinase